MPTETATRPVEDSVPKVNDEIAVGEDLEFQRRWWKFEKAVWLFLALLVVLDLIGLFGRGPLAKAQKQTADGALRLNYDWVERFSTPSILTLHFAPGAVHDGAIRLWVSDSTIIALGNQRVIPQPTSSVTGNGGIFYTFGATNRPDSVEFALEPSVIGPTHLTVRLLGAGPNDYINAGIFVMP